MRALYALMQVHGSKLFWPQTNNNDGRPTAHSANAGNACHAGQQQSHVTDGSNKWVA